MGGGKKKGAKKKAKPGAPCGNANAKKQPAAAAAAAAGEPAAAANGVGHKPPGPDAPPAPCGRKTPSHGVSFTGGSNVIVKCPTHKYDSTVAFYRDILGLTVEASTRDTCKIRWGRKTYLWVLKQDRLAHPCVWLTIEADDVAKAREVVQKREFLRGEIDPLSEGTASFWVSPLNDMVHLVKPPGPLEVHTDRPGKQSTAPVHTEPDYNPLDVAAASHAPNGQTAKLSDCHFSGGRNLALKCPYPKFRSTVAFYRETLGLQVVHFCKSCCKVIWNDELSLWIDRVDTFQHPVIWLEVSTASTESARAYLKGRKRVSLRPEVEVLPPGVDGFWISPPNDMVHLIRGPDGQDDIALPPGELFNLPFRADEDVVAVNRVLVASHTQAVHTATTDDVNDAPASSAASAAVDEDEA
ncbi:hypothetical protein DIPPA_23048 [Diplonema papillatum]|nr:hypothetical protein DIPPA_23048 [Diplonema papillatum]